MDRISRFAATVMVSGGLGLAAFNLGSGTAQAEPADTWYRFNLARARADDVPGRAGHCMASGARP